MEDGQEPIEDPFSKYYSMKEPGYRDRAYAWDTAIGLQDVDGIRPSEYLVDTAKRSVEGEIPVRDVEKLLESYYSSRERRSAANSTRTEEADKVAARIAVILSEGSFTFSASGYIGIHRRLFQGIFPHAGKLRDLDITKREWVLDGDTVTYGVVSEIMRTLEYDLSTEAEYEYPDMSPDAVIPHLARFVANLWQNHCFFEGNTRTTAVFFIKYLRTLGYDVTNDVFAENSWYFRNALVRANYSNISKGVRQTTVYLEKFLRNLLLGEHNVLSNRDLSIRGLLAAHDNDGVENKQDIGAYKQDIGAYKQDIGLSFTNKTASHVNRLYDVLRDREVFARPDVEAILGLSPSAASSLLRKMLDAGIIETVSGMGKGRYRFRRDQVPDHALSSDGGL